MASTLTSNPFRLSSPRSLKNSKLTVSAKGSGSGSFSPFQLGKPKDSSDETQSEDAGKSSPFRFKFGQLPDVKSLIPVVSNPSTGLSFGKPRRKDSGTVFVAGATGQAGIRIAQTLLREGFTVRAGVPDLGAAQELALVAASYKIISSEESRRLNAVESTFQDPESIAKAIGNASKVVVTIGPGENGPTAEVSTLDALKVIEAAQLAGVGHVAIIYDGNVAVASTYNVLDGITSFFNNIFSKSQSLTVPELLESVIQTDVGYTFIKTSLTEDFAPESKYNVVVSAEGNNGTNDYKVAKSTIASLVADVFSNTAVAENKVVEVFTDPSAPLKRVDELFSVIPEDGRRKAYAEALAKEKAEEAAKVAAEKAQEAAEMTKILEDEVKKLSEQEAKASGLAQEAQEKAEAAGAGVDVFLNKAKDFGSGLSWEKLSSQITTAVKESSEGINKVQIATVRGQAKARSLAPQKAFVKPKPKSAPKPVAKEADEEPKKGEVRKLFGGLFQQETIYVDED